MLKYLAFILLVLIPALAFGRWIEDQVRIDNDAVGTVIFSHYNHLDALGKNCVFCHNKVFNIEPAKNPRATMAEMEQGKSCGACHNGRKAFAVSGDCSSCHPVRDIEFKVDEGDARFSHEIHTGLYGCGDCHPGLFIPDRVRNQPASMAQMEEGLSCGACHDGNTAFSVTENCDSCHDM